VATGFVWSPGGGLGARQRDFELNEKESTMFALSRLFAAVASLAQSVEALAGSIGEANANFRQRLALDQPDPTPLLGHEPDGGDANGGESNGTGGTGRRPKRAA
jgi:hypothetical protein